MKSLTLLAIFFLAHNVANASQCVLKVFPSKLAEDTRVLNDITQKGYQVYFTEEQPNLLIEEYDRGTMLANKQGLYWADINCLAVLMDDRGENIKMIKKKFSFSSIRSTACLNKALKVVEALPSCNQ